MVRIARLSLTEVDSKVCVGYLLLVSFTVLIDSNQMQNGESFILSPGIFVHFSMFPHCTAGGNRFVEDVEMMIGSRSYIFWLWWKACWYFFSPVILAVSAKIPPLVCRL